MCCTIPHGILKTIFMVNIVKQNKSYTLHTVIYTLHVRVSLHLHLTASAIGGDGFSYSSLRYVSGNMISVRYNQAKAFEYRFHSHVIAICYCPDKT